MELGLRLSFEDRPSAPDEHVIGDRLGDYNAAFLRDNSYAYFGIFVRDDTGAIRAKLGYQEFARLDYPPDQQRIFLKKRLTAE